MLIRRNSHGCLGDILGAIHTIDPSCYARNLACNDRISQSEALYIGSLMH